MSCHRGLDSKLPSRAARTWLDLPRKAQEMLSSHRVTWLYVVVLNFFDILVSLKVKYQDCWLVKIVFLSTSLLWTWERSDPPLLTMELRAASYGISPQLLSASPDVLVMREVIGDWNPVIFVKFCVMFIIIIRFPLVPIVLLPSPPSTVYLLPLNYPLPVFPKEKADVNHEREPGQGLEAKRINYHLMDPTWYTYTSLYKHGEPTTC